jgi:putative transposase
MARLARVVIPGLAHHITQRGVRRMDVFFSDGDRAAYLALLRQFGREFGVEFWGYCLMSNHVHLVAVPQREESLAGALGWAHHHYTRRVNARQGWRGYLWQGRFYSCPMEPAHALRALRYAELNPVRAGLVKRAGDWRWSSARAHLRGRADPVLAACPSLKGLDWREFLAEGIAEAELADLRRHTRTGRPYGSLRWLGGLERRLGRVLQPQKRGRKRKAPGPQ